MMKKMVLILLVVGFSVSLSYGHPAEIWQTGQKTTYATGDDGDLEKGVFWPVPRFTDHGNGTITDNLTGLMWTKNANLAGGAKFWQEALDYVKSINSGAGLGGYHDWRLPNRKELFSLIDHSKWDPALPASHPFQNVQSDCYWSSTTDAFSTDGAWIVSMWDGFVYYLSKKPSDSDGFYVWPVRSGQGASSRNSLADFDGDRKTDVAGFHLPTDQFFTDYSGNLGQFGWGGSDSMPLVWDYDGDGKTDVSIYHIPTNQWFVKGVGNLGQYGWGGEESVPVPGDYNGDGQMERAFYHSPTNQWFVEGQDPVTFGWNCTESIPLPGDYDGDGKTDMVIYHIPSNQWFQYGVGNLGQFGWGGADCIPVPGDYNGDGKVEIAVYHVPTNQWFVKGIGNLGQYGWGGLESFPIPGDYNGDGVMEKGFYRPSENRWFIEGESDFIWGWGGSDFMPITSQIAVYNWFRFTLHKFFCTYSISPTSQSFGSTEGTGSVNVTTSSCCNWTAVSNVS
jgi:hypothetical protein